MLTAWNGEQVTVVVECIRRSDGAAITCPADTVVDVRSVGWAGESIGDLVDPTAPPPPPPPPPPAPGPCHPSYSPCVPMASDVDCSGGGGNGPVYVVGPIRVIGPDVYRLDDDKDGVACED